MKRVVEDFVCQHCGSKVTGNGYTDHCPVCLWGRHMDRDFPGDRASDCRGLMKPVRVLYVKGIYRIEYICEKCSHTFVVDAASEDSKEALLALFY